MSARGRADSLPLAFGTRRVCVVVGASTLLLAGSLRALGAAGESLLFACTIAIGLLAVAGSPPRSMSSVKVWRAALVFLLCAFATARAVTATGTPTRVALQVALEVIIVATTFWFALRLVDGLDRLASLIPEARDGYASLLHRETAVARFEAELARSRRSGEPLSLVVLQREAAGADSAAKEFLAAVEQLPRGVLTELERECTRARMCSLISVHVRRSDVVVVDSDECLLLLSAGTNGEGAERLAGRIVRDAEVSLGVPLVAGVAVCSSDELDLDELVVVAKNRMRSPEHRVEPITERRPGSRSEHGSPDGPLLAPTAVQGSDSGR